MDLICIIGSAPGPITATVSHAGQVRQVALEVARHKAGGWQVRLPGGDWGVRCHAVKTGVLLEAGAAFAELEDSVQATMLAAD